jgi:hypothetical protein
MSLDPSNRFSALKDGEEENERQLPVDGWEDDISLSNGSFSKVPNSHLKSVETRILKLIATKVQSIKPKHSIGAQMRTSSLVSAAVSLGFHLTRLSSQRETYIPRGRGGGMSNSPPPDGNIPLQTKDNYIPPRTQNLDIEIFSDPIEQDDEVMVVAETTTNTKKASNPARPDKPANNQEGHQPSLPSMGSSNSKPDTQSKETTNPSTAKLTFFTYRAQLTFGLSISCKEVNVATLFQQ